MKIYLLFVLILAYCYNAGGQGRRPGLLLSERVQQLTDLANKKSVLRFNANKFRDYVKSTPRNYSIVVMFTALASQRQCMVCRQASEEYTVVANSFKFSPGYSNKLFFAMVDFDEGSEVFQMLRLNTAPVFIHFPPKGKPKPYDTMDIQRYGFSAEALARWINERTDIQIRVFRPPNYSGTFIIILITTAIMGLAYMRRSNLEFLYNTSLWGIWGLIFTLAMTSGQMWNHIRGPPFVHKNHDGEVVYFHGSSQGQLVFETYAVFGMNAAVVVGMILMIEAAKNKSDPKLKKIFALVGLVFTAFFFSAILSLFRRKTQGYPYSFLLR